MRLSVVMFLMLAIGLASNAQMPTSISDLKPIYESELKRIGIVGSSFAFISDGKISRLNYGSANLEKAAG